MLWRTRPPCAPAPLADRSTRSSKLAGGGAGASSRRTVGFTTCGASGGAGPPAGLSPQMPARHLSMASVRPARARARVRKTVGVVGVGARAKLLRHAHGDEASPQIAGTAEARECHGEIRLVAP